MSPAPGKTSVLKSVQCLTSSFTLLRRLEHRSSAPLGSWSQREQKQTSQTKGAKIPSLGPGRTPRGAGRLPSLSTCVSIASLLQHPYSPRPDPPPTSSCPSKGEGSAEATGEPSPKLTHPESPINDYTRGSGAAGHQKTPLKDQRNGSLCEGACPQEA